MLLLSAGHTVLTVLKYIGIIFGPIIVIVITLRVKYLSHAIGTLFGVALAVGYAFRNKLFEVLFSVESYESLQGFNKIKYLWILVSVCTFIWFVYINSSRWMRADEAGSHFDVTTSSGTTEWSVLGWMSFIGLIVAAVVGLGVSWLNCSVWSGFVYVLAGIEILAGIASFIIALVA